MQHQKSLKKKAEDKAKGGSKKIAKQALIISSMEQAESSTNLRKELNMDLLCTFACANVSIKKTTL